MVFLFLFANSGAVNACWRCSASTVRSGSPILAACCTLLLGRIGLVDPEAPPAALTGGGPFGLSWWEWLSGPSVAMCTIIMLVIWTTSGTFMLMFLAALQDIPVELEEASMIDGAGRLAAPAARDAAAAQADALPGADARPDRHLAGLRPGLRDEPGQPGEDHADPGVPVLPDRFRDFEYGTGTAISFVPFRSSWYWRWSSAGSCAVAPTGPASVARRGGGGHDGESTDPNAASPTPARGLSRSRGTGRCRRQAPASTFAGYAVLVFFSLVFLYPFVIQIANSFKTEPDAAANPLSPFPHPISLGGYERVFLGTDLPLWLGTRCS